MRELYFLLLGPGDLELVCRAPWDHPAEGIHAGGNLLAVFEDGPARVVACPLFLRDEAEFERVAAWVRRVGGRADPPSAFWRTGPDGKNSHWDCPPLAGQPEGARR